MKRSTMHILLILAMVLCLCAFQSKNAEAYDQRYTGADDGSRVAIWQPNFSVGGLYQVYAWWAAGGPEASTSAPYTIYFDGGNGPITVNQQFSSSGWYLLGTYNFASGSSGYVELRSTLTGTVIADAIKFEQVEGSEIIIIDNGDAEFSLQGAWTCEAGVPGAYPPGTEEILAFFDDSVADGSLEGTGPGASAARRLNALRNMIETAQDLIEAGDIEGACGQLMAALGKCDGEALPPDFAEGASAEELANMIEDLLDDLGC